MGTVKCTLMACLVTTGLRCSGEVSGTVSIGASPALHRGWGLEGRQRGGERGANEAPRDAQLGGSFGGSIAG